SARWHTDAAGPLSWRRFSHFQMARDRVIRAGATHGLARAGRGLQRRFLQLRTGETWRNSDRHRFGYALSCAGALGREAVWSRAPRRVSSHAGVRACALRRAFRSRLVHGRLLPLALSAARARLARAAYASAYDVPDPYHAGRFRLRAAAGLPDRGPNTSARIRLAENGFHR